LTKLALICRIRPTSLKFEVIGYTRLGSIYRLPHAITCDYTFFLTFLLDFLFNIRILRLHRSHTWLYAFGQGHLSCFGIWRIPYFSSFDLHPYWCLRSTPLAESKHRIGVGLDSVIRIGFKLDGHVKVVEQTIFLPPLLSFFFRGWLRGHGCAHCIRQEVETAIPTIGNCENSRFVLSTCEK
jgi:hypothetical protein